MKISAVLLAGGHSRRMGRDKAFLEIGGLPLWKIQAAKLDAVAAEVWISRRADQPGPAIWSLAAPAGNNSPVSPAYPLLPDPPDAAGPLAGIVSALRAAALPHVLALAVDLPFLTPACLSRITSRATATSGCVPELDGFLQGTAALYPRTLLPLAEQALREKNFALQSLLRKALAAGLMHPLPVPEEDRPLFSNWNAPEDLNPVQPGSFLQRTDQRSKHKHM